MTLDSEIDSGDIKETEQQKQLETTVTKDGHIQNQATNLSPKKQEYIRSTSSIITKESRLTDVDKGIKRYKSQVSQLSSKSNSNQAKRSISFALTHRSSLLDSKLALQAVDYPDSIPSYMSFTYLDILTLSFSICTFLCDLITDIVVTVFHYSNHDYWYFSLTITFIAVPTLIMTIMSLRWYILDSKDPHSLPVSKTQWVLRVIFLTLQLGPVMRYIDSILYGFKFRKLNEEKQKAARRYFQYMIYEDTDATMLRLFECFMEAAPQLVLQMTVMIIKMPEKNRDWTVMAQSISIIASLVSLSWCLVTYLRILRMSLASKQNMTWPGTIVQFLWRFFMIASRVMALALFASEFTYYISIVCGVHWLIMFIWIVSMKTSFCTNRIEELFYNAVLSIIFIFCYFNPVDGQSRKRYIFYYTVMFIENLIILLLWYNVCDPSKWYRLPAFLLYFFNFFISLIFMTIYYLKLHPTQNIKIFHDSTTTNIDPKMTCTSSSIRSSPGSLMETTMTKSSTSTNSPDQSPIKQQSIIVYEPKDKRIESKIKSTKSSTTKNYKRQFSDVWTTNGRLLHPRPAMPTV
ncbi:XK-related protein 6 [Dermatophagoides farinae]|uniref:XK-related protein 6 n=1 Tax=Dermatophagoides farinae TaxID=6954 RepID=UPI003F5DCBA0